MGKLVEMLCDGNCREYESWMEIPAGNYTIKVNQADRNGNHCYREEVITVQETNTSPIVTPQNNDISCEFITFQGASNQIYINGLTADYNKVEYIGAGTKWQVETLCDGNCAPDERIFNLATGSYKVKINQRNEQTQFVNHSRVGGHGKYCYREEVVQVLRGSLDRNSLANQDDLMVFPNPAKDQLHLTMSDWGKPVQIKIYNAFGNLVKTVPKQTIGDGLSIDLTGFENGMYFLSVFQNNSKVVSKRFLVEHLR